FPTRRSSDLTLGALGMSLWLGPTPASVAVARCRALLAPHGIDRRIVRVTANCPLALLLALQERFAEARACLAEARSTAAELGHAEAAAFLPLFEATVAALAGEDECAEQLLGEAIDACRRIGDVSTL